MVADTWKGKWMSNVIPKVKYLTNKEMMEELHKSKKSYSSFLAPEYGEYDFIAPSLESVTLDRLEDERTTKFNRTVAALKKEKTTQGIKNPVIA
jgi:hypothetical protein